MRIRRASDIDVGRYYLIKGKVGDLPIPVQVLQVTHKGETAGRPWVKGTLWLRLGQTHGERMWKNQHVFLDQIGIGIPVWHENDIWMETLPPKLEKLTGRGYHEVVQENTYRSDEKEKKVRAARIEVVSR